MMFSLDLPDQVKVNVGDHVTVSADGRTVADGVVTSTVGCTVHFEREEDPLDPLDPVDAAQMTEAWERARPMRVAHVASVAGTGRRLYSVLLD